MAAVMDVAIRTNRGKVPGVGMLDELDELAFELPVRWPRLQ